MNGFYINLEERTDRNKHFQNLKVKFPFFRNVERFNAIYNETYGVGCMLSHIECLEKCLTLNDEYYIIMEDDFYIFNEDNFKNFTIEFQKIKNNKTWKVITLTPRGITNEKNYILSFNRICDTQTATGYIIRHNYINDLLSILYKSLDGLKNAKTRNESHPYCIDQCWKSLQFYDIWLYFNDVFAGQLPGYSNIEKRNTNYNKRFLEQYKY